MSESPGTGAGAASLDAGAPMPGGEPAEPDPSRRRRVLGTVATVLAGAVIVAVAVVAAVFLFHRLHHAPAPRPGTVAVFGLRPGQCVNSAPNGTGVVTVVSCAKPHDAEVYSDFRMPGSHWPGNAAISAQAQRGCQQRMTAAMKQPYALAGLAQSYIYPSQDAWAAGERTVICELRATQGKLTGSVQAVAR
jgi:Septum formation